MRLREEIAPYPLINRGPIKSIWCISSIRVGFRIVYRFLDLTRLYRSRLFTFSLCFFTIRFIVDTEGISSFEKTSFSILYRIASAHTPRYFDSCSLPSIRAFLIDKPIDHADTENDFRVLTGMASQLNYTEEQFNIMLKEVMEAYKKGGGSKLLEMAFSL